MTPKEKAIELYNNFRNQNSIMSANIRGKKCAIIAVNEILKIQTLKSTKMSAKLDRYSESDSVEYWNEVLEEINKL